MADECGAAIDYVESELYEAVAALADPDGATTTVMWAYRSVSMTAGRTETGADWVAELVPGDQGDDH